jgi:hypothetical protein
MPDQPNKPGGDFTPDGSVRDAGEERAVKNQGEVRPEDYPEPAAGEQVKTHQKDG